MGSNDAIIYIVRHGETDWNAEGRLQGHTDIPLNEKGKHQAEKLNKLLQPIHFDAVFSSDLSRTLQTAKIITIDRQLEINTSELLRERRYGRWEGKLSAEYREQNKSLLEEYEKSTIEEQWKFKVSEDVENNQEMMTRFIYFLREIALTYVSSTVLVVTHIGIMRNLLVHLGWATHNELFSIAGFKAVDNTAYIKLRSDGIDFFIEDTQGIRKKAGLSLFNLSTI